MRSQSWPRLSGLEQQASPTMRAVGGSLAELDKAGSAPEQRDVAGGLELNTPPICFSTLQHYANFKMLCTLKGSGSVNFCPNQFIRGRTLNYYIFTGLDFNRFMSFEPKRYT